MSKKTPETSPRKPRTTPRSKPKAAPASKQPVAETAVATVEKVETVLSTPKVTPEQILEQLRSGQPIDSTGWREFAVEIVNGKISIKKRVGCVTKTVVDGESLPPERGKFTIGYCGSVPLGKQHIVGRNVTRGFNSEEKLVAFLEKLAENGNFSMLADIRTNDGTDRNIRHMAMRILEKNIDVIIASVSDQGILQTMAMYGFDKEVRLKAVNKLKELKMRTPLEKLAQCRRMPEQYRDPEIIKAAQDALKAMDNPIAPVDTPTAETTVEPEPLSSDELAVLKGVEAEASPITLETTMEKWNIARKKLEVASERLNSAQYELDKAMKESSVAREKSDAVWEKLDVAIEKSNAAWEKFATANNTEDIKEKINLLNTAAELLEAGIALREETINLLNEAIELLQTSEVAPIAPAVEPVATKPATPPPPPVKNGNGGQQDVVAPAVTQSTPATEQPVISLPVSPTATDADTLDDDLVRDIFGEEEELEREGSPAPADNCPAEAPKKTFSDQVNKLKTRVDAFKNGQSTETLDDLFASARELEEISGNLHGEEFQKSLDAISTLGALTAGLQRVQQRGSQPSKAERHAAPRYFAPGTGDPDRIQPSGTPTPPLGSSAVPAKPNVQVPFLEAETQVLRADGVQAAELARIEESRGKVGKLEERFASLNGQAQPLLKGEPASSGTDIPTIVTVFNGLKTETADLLNSLLADANSNKGLIDRLKKLEGEIKGVVLSLEQKQRNGVEAEFYDRKADSEVAQAPRVPFYVRRYKDLLLAASVLIAAGIVGTRTCASDEQKLSAPAVPPEETTTTDELIKQADELIKEIEENPVIPVPAPSKERLEEVWNQYVKPTLETPPAPTEQPATDLNLESVGTTEPPVTTTTTFNCEVDTTDTALIECVEQGAPDADVTEKLAWTGPYNPKTKTVPAEVTFETPDGEQFKTTFDVQIGTRQQLSWTLKAVKAE